MPKNTGFKTLPKLDAMLFSLYDNKNAAKKNNAEKPNNATC